MFLTVFSLASKLGGIWATYVGRETCPPSCALYDNGCYGKSVRLRPHWEKAEKVGRDIDGLVRLIRSFMPGERYRYAIVGDLPGAGEGIDTKSLLAVADAVRSAHVVGWTFTHKQPSYGDNAAAIAEANRRGFAINMSAHGPAHADELMDLGIGPVVTLLPCEKPLAPRKTPKGRPIVFCPASMKGSRITCRTCGKGKGPLCARIDRDYVVGFFAHGPAKRVAEATYRPGLPVVA